MRREFRTSFALAAAVLLAAVLLLAGCTRRPLLESSEAVRIMVKVDVKAVANVTTDIYNEKIPVPDLNTDMMRVLVYDPDTKNLLTQSFISNKSYDGEGNQVFTGSLAISHGDFDFLVYNFDTPTTQISSESNEMQILAYTGSIPESLRSKYGVTKSDDEGAVAINYEPDHLVVAREPGLRVSPHDTLVVIHTTARTIIDTYYLQVHVEGMQYASAATAVITGLSPSNHIGPDIRTDDPTAAVCFDLLKSTDDNIAGANKDVLCAVFNTFGKVEDADSDLHVTFNVTDTAGNLLKYDCDLNTVFRSEYAIRYHWLLVDDTIVIPNPTPNPGPNPGGFQPQVDDWTEEEGTIVL